MADPRERAADGGVVPFVEPRSRLESTIAHLWRELLNVDRVGAEDNFFRLGGESLLAVHMLSAVEDVLLAPVSFTDFVDAPTVAELAAAVERARERPARAELPIERGPADGRAPCAFGQERLWFIEEMTEGKGGYNLPLGARIHASVDADILERSLQDIVRRHAALRTTFAVKDGRPLQVVSPDGRFPLERHDVRNRPDPEAEAHRLADELVAKPFDLQRGPLVRALLLRLADEECVLQLVFHHIVCDGWSHVVVFRELATLYRAYSRGEESGLAEPRVQYPDFARWQRSWLDGPVLEEKIARWRERLAGIPAALELPTDRPRPPIPSFEGATRRLPLSATTVEAVRAFSRAEGTTPFATLLAVFDVLLFRYSGQETIVIGAATAGRDRPELEDAIGFFTNTVVLRNDLSGEPAFRELLGRTHDVVLDAVAHEDTPFERLVAELQPERDLSRHPLFQVFIAQVPYAPLELEGADRFDANPKTARFDLTLFIEEKAEGLDLVWEYSTDLFDGESIDRMGAHFVRLLEAALADPEQQISELPLLTDAERRQLLVEWNDTAVVYPDVCLHELFEGQVDRTPDAPAVVYGNDVLSFRDLDERANRLAHHLQQLGVGANSLVAISAERSLELVVGLIGILKAGGAYVPLDPSYPAERLAFMLDDSKAAVLLTAGDAIEGLHVSEDVAVVRLDADWSRISQRAAERPRSLTTPEDLAYVIYTSGSTGRPKGAMNTHRGIVNRLLWMQDAYGLADDDRVLQKTPYSFDVSVWEFFWPLLTSARLVVARPDGHQDPDYLVEVIEQQRVTTIHFVPSMLHLFLNAPELERCKSLRRVICSGEALSTELVERFFERFDCELHNLYGPTEAAVDVTAWQCAPGLRSPIVPIGKPIANTQIYVLDAGMKPTPIGVPGELLIGGVQLARGYLNRPELTAERFVPNPFGGEHLYRTGDLARWSAVGDLEFLGRLDDQIKLRGVRIELGEVESVLSEHDDVETSVVVPIELGPADTRLVAYVVPRQRGAATGNFVADLRRFLRQKLLEPMVPAAFVILEELPLSPNGKLDRRALPPPADLRPDLETEYAAPRTPVEEELAAIWAETLGVERVGINDNFFDLGGHSLLMAQGAARARERLGVDVSVRTMFERPTVAMLAAHLDDQLTTGAAAGTATSVAPIAKRSQHEPFPLSLSQQGLWLLDRWEPGAPTYNVAFPFRIRGPVDVPALHDALTALVERHEALRTVFVLQGDEPECVTRSDCVPELRQLDLRGLEPAEREEEVSRLLREEARRPFDLERDLLLRATIARLEDEEHILLVQTHHIAFDGWSLSVFCSELSELYEASLDGRPSRLPEPVLQYGDFAVWQREHLRGERLDASLAWWREQLAGAPTIVDLLSDRPRGSAVAEARTYRFELPSSLADAVRAHSRSERVTPFILLLAAFATVLYRRTGQHDVVVGSPMANRERVELEGLVGFCSNTVVLRPRLGGNPTFRELLARVRDVVLDAHAHHEVPFELVVQAVRPERDTGANPLFQVNFRVLTDRPAQLELRGLTVEPVTLDSGLARFDLALELQLDDGCIAGHLDYNADLFEPDTIARLVADFEQLLGDVLSDPDRRLVSLELADAEPLPPGLDTASETGIRRFREKGANVR